MSESVVLVEQNGAVLTITLNRPDVLNAFSDALIEGLRDALLHAAHDPTVRCVVISGAGRGFCAGQDVRAMVEHQLSPADIAHLLRVGYNVIISTIREMEKPVVAAINGVAAGIGLSLALACDMRLCAANAVLTTGFARIGLIPDGGQTALLPLLVGYARAAELVFFSERIDANAALQMGLVNQVVPPEALASETAVLAGKLAALPTRAIGLSKQAFNQALLPHLAAQLDLEAELQASAMQTHDHREGIAAFLEKRAASFSGS